MSGPHRRAAELKPGHRIHRDGQVGTVVQVSDETTDKMWTVEVTAMPLHRNDTLPPQSFIAYWDDLIDLEYID